MLGNNNTNGKRKPEHGQWCEYYVADTGRMHYIPIYKRTAKRMEAKIIISVLYFIGVPTYVLGILANIGWLQIDNWKATVLFVLAAMFAVAKIFFYCLRQWQQYLMRKKELRK